MVDKSKEETHKRIVEVELLWANGVVGLSSDTQAERTPPARYPTDFFCVTFISLATVMIFVMCIYQIHQFRYAHLLEDDVMGVVFFLATHHVLCF